MSGELPPVLRPQHDISAVESPRRGHRRSDKETIAQVEEHKLQRLRLQRLIERNSVRPSRQVLKRLAKREEERTDAAAFGAHLERIRADRLSFLLTRADFSKNTAELNELAASVQLPKKPMPMLSNSDVGRLYSLEENLVQYHSRAFTAPPAPFLGLEILRRQ